MKRESLKSNNARVSISGASQCSWSSCREGCTKDLFECNHVYVEYVPNPEDVDKVKHKNIGITNQKTVSSFLVTYLF